MPTNFRPNSLRGRVRAFVLAHGDSTVSEVLAAVGRFIGSPQALARARSVARYNRKYFRTFQGQDGDDRFAASQAETDRLLRAGRRFLVTEALRLMVRSGHLRRVARGVYGPPLPKLHDPDDKAAPPVSPELPPGQAGTG